MGCPRLYEDWRFVSAETAEYAYSPYGALAKSSGPDADESPFLFSSEYLDSETNLVYYNYRYYSPELGRWTKRDPIGEDGGHNLYGMVGNDPVGRWDARGLLSDNDFEEREAGFPKGETAAVEGIYKLVEGYSAKLKQNPCPFKNVDKSVCQSCRQFTCTAVENVPAEVTLTLNYTKLKGTTVSGNLLKHEWGHKVLFEHYLSEVKAAVRNIEGTGVACSMREAWEKAQDDYLKKVQDAFDKAIKKVSDIQKTYDKETDHSRNIKNQKKWNKRLKKLETQQ